MNKIKEQIKKHFSSFTFFYRYLHNAIFIVLGLSMVVSILDAFGLTMFLPLLQVVGGEGNVNPEEMGRLRFIVEGMANIGFNLTISSVLLFMFLFFCFKGIVYYFNSIYGVILQQRFIKRIRLDLLKNLNRMSFKKFILSDAGRIQNTMSGEVDRVDQAFRTYFTTFQQAAMVIVYMGFAFFLDVQFALLVTVGGVATNLLYKLIYERTKNASRKLTGFTSVFQGQIIQHVLHFKYLKATGKIDHYGNRLKETINAIENSRRRIGFLNSIGASAREPMLVAVIAVVILIQVNFLGGAMATILITLMFFYRALTSLLSMQQNWNSYMSVSGSLENLQDFQKELKSSKEEDGKEIFRSFTKGISLQKVDFYYGETPILKKIDLQIRKNESIALVGESGSGKTTLINLITGLLPEDGGVIQVDGQPLKSISKVTYQERIGYVSQDPVVFNDTLYNNVTLWAPKIEQNLTRFEKSMRQASLWDFTQELPKGLDTELGNNGINLSGGQKQRVSIARELFKDIDILILDEATSALDSETEKAIQESINALQGEYTLIIVAHRLATIRNVDKIALLDKGEIVDVANFENLVNKQDRFKKMVELQEL